MMAKCDKLIIEQVQVLANISPCGRRQTDTQIRVTTIHFASSTTHVKCNHMANGPLTLRLNTIQHRTRMWANVMAALPWWCRLFNAAVWLTPTTGVPYSNAAKTRNLLKVAGVPQINETILAASGPKFTILWKHLEEMLLLNKFFSYVHACLSCEDIAWQSCTMAGRLRFFASCSFSEHGGMVEVGTG